MYIKKGIFVQHRKCILASMRINTIFQNLNIRTNNYINFINMEYAPPVLYEYSLYSKIYIQYNRLLKIKLLICQKDLLLAVDVVQKFHSVVY